MVIMPVIRWVSGSTPTNTGGGAQLFPIYGFESHKKRHARTSQWSTSSQKMVIIKRGNVNSTTLDIYTTRTHYVCTYIYICICIYNYMYIYIYIIYIIYINTSYEDDVPTFPSPF